MPDRDCAAKGHEREAFCELCFKTMEQAEDAARHRALDEAIAAIREADAAERSRTPPGDPKCDAGHGVRLAIDAVAALRDRNQEPHP